MREAIKTAWLTRLLLVGMLLLAALGSAAATAAASPSWEVSVQAEGPFGAASFERESFADLYKVKITNVGNQTAGGVAAGEALECAGGPVTATSVQYRWLRNGVEIVGATSSRYVLTAADEGKFLQCEALASNGEATVAATSAQIPVAPIPATVAPAGAQPAITGTATVGETLTCSAGSWKPAAEHYEYQWLRNGALIAGSGSGVTTASTATYKLVAADAARAIQCEVVASGPEGAAAAVSKAVQARGLPPASAAAPAVSGTGSVGETLTCTNSSWSGAPSEYEYVWLRNGVPISGAKLPRTNAASYTYTLQDEDERAAIQCEVIATSPEGVVGRVSAPLAVGTLSTAPSAAPSLSLSAASVGTSLTCSHGTWAPAATSYEYRWLRNGVAIPGSTTGPGSTAASAQYTPVAEDAGKALQCEVVATNAGGTFAAGLTPASYVAPALIAATSTISTPALTLTNTLPEGIEPATSAQTYAPFPLVPAGWSCRVEGTTRSTEQCTTSYDPVAPGESRSFEFYVVTTETAADTADLTSSVTDEAASPSVSSVVYPTTVTSGAFGIETFNIKTVDEQGDPFTQSTGHPFEAVANFVFDPTSSSGKPESPHASQVATRTAGGEPKNVAVELPPGFIGAPALEEQCSVTELHENVCATKHPNSAVGYINVATTGWIENGRSVAPPGEFSPSTSANLLLSSLIYNLVPPAGTPAAFGYTADGQIFYLEASVRSNGDYGVTITNRSTPSFPIILMGAETVFCGYGARRVTGVATRNGCKAAKPGDVAFLSNPASCTGGAPVVTLKADTWERSEDYVSKSAYAGTSQEVLEGSPSASESFVTGCEKTVFEPSTELEPDTTRADSPTGLAVDLIVPQENNVPALTEGERLGCVNPLTTEYPSAYSYQWLKGGAEVAGATGQSYVLASLSEADSLQCRVAASNSGGGAAGVSLPLEVSSSLPAAPVAGPTVSGEAASGKTLTCAAGAWTGSPMSYAYEWLKNGAPISGATSSTYAVQAGDVPSTLQCEVSATNAAGSIAAVSASKSTTPAPATKPPAVSAAPEVSAPPSAPGTPEVKDVSVTFPKGMSLSPSAAGGLEGCTDVQFAIHSLAAATCPEGSKIGTVKITTPLLTLPLEGQLYLGQPLCGEPTPCSSEDAQSGKMFRLFIQAIDPENGVIVKVAGNVSVDPETGQFTATFDENPQLPFEKLALRLKNGPRAPLATPQTCGTSTAVSELVPWSSAGLGGPSGAEEIGGTPNATSETSFQVSWNGEGEACPATLPFSPGFVAGTTSAAAAANGSNALSVSLTREDREQDLGGITLHTPAGLLGYVSKVSLCEEPQAAAGTCAASSRIGSVTAGAGPGADPYFVTGSVYLTGPYKGDPFGLSIVVPTKAGPFNLGNVVVRASVAVDPHTADLTVTSDPLPQILDGIPLRLRKVNVTVDKEGFIVNPTSCEAKQITATITGAPPREDQSEPVKSSNVASSFDVGGCAEEPFKPSFTASTQAKTSRSRGASLHVAIQYPAGGGQANIHMVHVELPKALPSRLSTLQKACPEATFDANPSSCPAASVVGTAVAHTPVLSVPLQGPAYFVSHGGAKFPELILVLQGQGVTIVLEGETFISKAGVTSSTFKTVPDAPVSSFELTLPEGKDSALAAPGNKLCTKKLVMPTTITAQSGRQITQKTKIKVTGCSTGSKKKTKKKTKKKSNKRRKQRIAASHHGRQLKKKRRSLSGASAEH